MVFLMVSCGRIDSSLPNTRQFFAVRYFRLWTSGFRGLFGRLCHTECHKRSVKREIKDTKSIAWISVLKCIITLVYKGQKAKKKENLQKGGTKIVTHEYQPDFQRLTDFRNFHMIFKFWSADYLQMKENEFLANREFRNFKLLKITAPFMKQHFL